MLYSGTDPESHITEYTLVYEDNRRGDNLVGGAVCGGRRSFAFLEVSRVSGKVSLSLSLSMYIYLSLSVSLSLSVCLSVCLSLSLSLYV